MLQLRDEEEVVIGDSSSIADLRLAGSSSAKTAINLTASATHGKRLRPTGKKLCFAMELDLLPVIHNAARVLKPRRIH